MKKTLIVVAAGVLAGQVWAGYQITMTTVTEGAPRGRQSRDEANRSTVVMSTDADKARIDFKEGQAPGAGEGSYVITKDAGQTFYMVSPKEKTYMKWDMDSMMNMAGAMGGMMKMEVSDPKVETLLDEAGEPILGYPTRHYRFRTSYRMSMTVMGFRNESSNTRDEDVWATTGLDIATWGAWVKKMPKVQNAELEKLMQAEMGKLRGMTLRMKSEQTSVDGQGKTNVTHTIMNVTEIKKIGAGDISLDIPADYQEMNLFQRGEEDTAPTGRPGASRGARAPSMDFNSMMKKAMEDAGRE